MTAKIENKRCPFCGEEIKAVAIKCKHCNSLLTDNKHATQIEKKTEIVWLLLYVLGYFISSIIIFYLMDMTDEGLLYVVLVIITNIIHFLITIIPATIAKAKGKNFIVWYVYGLFLAIIALVHAVLLPHKNNTETVVEKQHANQNLLAPDSNQNTPMTYSEPPNISTESESEYKNCPLCGEEIKSVAVKCKHCGSLVASKGSTTQDSMVDGTLGLVSLISGIVGFFIGILLVHLGVLLGLTAVVCGVLGFGKGQKYSLPGIVTGIAAVLFSLIYSFMSMSRF